MAENRVTQVTIQAIVQGSPAARVTQVTIQAIIPVNALYGNPGKGITSGQAFGSGGALLQSTQFLSGANGIASAGAFGSGGALTLQFQFLYGSGISSSLAFGVGGSTTGPILGSSGISSAEAFGESEGRLYEGLIGEAGIPSAEAFGSPGLIGSIGGPLTGNIGIPAGSFGGVGRVAGPIGVAAQDAGISSSEAFGSGGFLSWRIFRTAGIPSSETFGTPGRLYRGLWGAIGIPSSEAFGLPGNGAVLSLSNAYTNFAVYIASAVRTPYLTVGSLRVDRQINFQAACGLNLLVKDGSGYRPAEGSEVVIYYLDEVSSTWNRIFAGYVDMVSSSRYGGPVGAYLHEVQCSDYARALTRRLVTMKFPQERFGTLSSIMSWLQDNILTGEGVQYLDLGDPNNTTIPDLEFNGTFCNEVLDRLCEICGLDWQVDFNRILRVYDRPSEVLSAPFDITEETTGNNAETWFNLTYRRTRGLYRNRQYVKASYSKKTQIVRETYPVGLWDSQAGLAPPWREFQTGEFLKDDRYAGKVIRVNRMILNGTTDLTWFLQWNEVGGSSNPAPAGWDYMQIWPNDLQFIWNLLGKPGLNPTTGDSVTVEFEVGLDLPPMLVFENTAEIAARKAIEGGSGIYEAVEEVSDIEDPATLEEIGVKLLAKFGVMGKEVDFSTYRYGLQPGMETNAHLPNLGLSSPELMNVERISYTEDDKRRLIHTVTISNQIQQRDALASFQRLLRRLKKPTARATQALAFTLAETIPGMTNPGLIAGASTAAHLVRKTFTLIEANLYFKTLPSGQNIKIDIRVDGVSILPSGTSVEYSTTQSGILTHTKFKDAPVTISKGSVVTAHVVQVGSGQPGKDGTLMLLGYV